MAATETSILYFKMQNPADMLAVHFFAETGQLRGEFLQETDPPWNIWWAEGKTSGILGTLGGLLRRPPVEAPGVWPTGTPQGPLVKTTWLDVFRKFVLRPDEERRLGEVVILRTACKSVFLEVIRRHYLLQQGFVEFTHFQDTPPSWLVRIRKPSIWAMDFLPASGEYQVFNQVPGVDSLFVESGWSLSDPANGLKLNQFRFTEKGLLLLRPDGRSDYLSPLWKHANSLITVEARPPTTAQPEEKEKIVIVPRLRDTDEKTLITLWKVTEAKRLQAILANETMKRLAGYLAWFTQDGTIWLLAQDEHADRGVASVFSDAFPGFYRLEGKVFIPHGKSLLPRLSEERLQQIFQCPRTDTLCLEPNESHESEPGRTTGPDLPVLGSAGENKPAVPGDFAVTRLVADGWKPIEYFITLLAGNAVKQAVLQDAAWKFDFPDVKKKE